jgi:hypothetical protein
MLVRFCVNQIAYFELIPAANTFRTALQADMTVFGKQIALPLHCVRSTRSLPNQLMKEVIYGRAERI